MSNAPPPSSEASASTRDVGSTFDNANKGGLAAINALVLLACTLTSAALALYSDLMARAAPLATGWLAIAAWLATLTIALYFAGNVAFKEERGSVIEANGTKASLQPNPQKRGFWVVLARGAASATQRPVLALVVVVIATGAVFSAWSKAKSDSGGVLASLAQTVLAVREDTAVIRQEVTRPIPPPEQLARLGFTTTTQDVCKAIIAGRVDVIKLMQAVGLPNKAVGTSVGGGYYATCLEDELLGGPQPGKDLSEMLAALPNVNGELDRLYLSQNLSSDNTGPVNIQSIARAGKLPLNSRDKLMTPEAPLLMYAVWGGNAQAVSGLLKAGANANKSAHVELLGSPMRFHAIRISPLAEAERLGHAEIIAILKANGARVSHSTARSRSDSLNSDTTSNVAPPKSFDPQPSPVVKAW